MLFFTSVRAHLRQKLAKCVDWLFHTDLVHLPREEFHQMLQAIQQTELDAPDVPCGRKPSESALLSMFRLGKVAQQEPPEPRTDPLSQLADIHAQLEAKRAQARAETERMRLSLVDDMTETQRLPAVQSARARKIQRDLEQWEQEQHTDKLHLHRIRLERGPDTYELPAMPVWKKDTWLV